MVTLLPVQYLANTSSTVVVNLPHHPNAEGLSLAAVIGTGVVKMAKRQYSMPKMFYRIGPKNLPSSFT